MSRLESNHSSLRLADIGLFICTLRPFGLTYFDSSIKPIDFWSLFMKWLGNTDNWGVWHL